MEIEKNYSILKACRFCPMCKHLCSSGNLTMHESDYPRGRGLIMFGVYRGEEFNADYVNSIYNCFMCGSCLAGCEGDFDLPTLIKSARADIVILNKEPQAIKTLKESLVLKGNIYGQSYKESFTFKNKKHEKKGADILYIAGQGVNYNHFETAQAAVDFFEKTNTDFSLIAEEPDCGGALGMLGYIKEAEAAAKKFYEKITNLKPGKIVTSDPMIIDCLLNDFKDFGIEFSPKIEFMHFSDFAAGIFKEKNLVLNKINKKTTVADSEFLCKKNGLCSGLRPMLKKAAGDNFIELYRNKKEAYATGEAAFYQNQEIFKDGAALGEKIFKDALKLEIETIITMSAAAKENISAAALGKIKVIDCAEFITENI